jgi:hypothetical protein
MTAVFSRLNLRTRHAEVTSDPPNMVKDNADNKKIQPIRR